MKKVIALTALSLFMASSAFAAGSLTLSLASGSTGLTLYGAKSGSAAATSPLIGKTSTGIGLGMVLDTTAGAGYALKTQHKSGTKVFGSTYDSTSIYSKDVTAGTADSTSITTNVSCFNGWTTL